MTPWNEDKTLQDTAKAAKAAAEQAAEAVAQPVEKLASTTADGLKRFVSLEASGGMTLMAAAFAALIVSNSPLSEAYSDLLSTRLAVRAGDLVLAKSVVHWVNDGLMVIFFFLVGLEMKREFFEGELNSLQKLLLPFVAAVGGMVVPVAIFFAVNADDPRTLEGWAIPTATDIAFALGILSLLGSRVPASLSAFLLSLAVFDDLFAIAIIAFFYSSKISAYAIVAATGLLVLLAILNLSDVRRIGIHLAFGMLLWLAVLESGVHATVAGVLLALTIPITERDGHSPLKHIENKLHPWVVLMILPLFAFVNAGVGLGGVSLASLADGMTLGIVLGLLLGKPLGVMAASSLCIWLGRQQIPEDSSWGMLFGASLLAGIGFTMSLFIGTLVYDNAQFDAQIRLGVLGASVLAALLGYLVLKVSIDQHGD